VAGGGLRRSRGDVRRADVRQGGPGAAGPGGTGGVAVRGGGARVGVLHLAGPSRDSPAAGHRAAAGGDGAARADEPGQLRPAVPVPGPAPGRRAGEPDRRAAVQARPAERGDGLPGPGDIGAARGPVGVPVHPRPDDTARSQARRRQGGKGRGRRRGDPVEILRLNQDPAAGASSAAYPARVGDPGRAGRTDARAGRDTAPRRIHAQPAVLRTAADARLYLEHPPLPPRLRRDTRRRPDPAPRHARHRYQPRRAGRQPPGDHRRARHGHRAGVHLHGCAHRRPARGRHGTYQTRPGGSGRTAGVGQDRDGLRRHRGAPDVDAGPGGPQGTGRPVAGADRGVPRREGGAARRRPGEATRQRRPRHLADPGPPRRHRRAHRRVRAGRRGRVPPRAGRRLRRRCEAGPGAALARADRHPVPP
jgi:hypothetical protein